MARASLGRRFLALVASSGLSNLADGLYKVALPLAAVQYTRSPALVAGLELVRTLPWLIGALPVGALVDRLDRRRTMLNANTARLGFTALAAVGIVLGGPPLILLYVAGLGTGMAEVFYDTAAQSIIPAVVMRDDLERANGRLYAVERGAQEFMGPPIGGLLVAVAVPLVFGASALLWAAAIVALWFLRGEFRPPSGGTSRRLRTDIRDGLDFIRERPLLWRLAVMVGVANLASAATFSVFVLYAVGEESVLGLDEPGFGVLFSLLAAGGIAGGVLSGHLQRRLGRARTLTASLAGMVAYVVVPALTESVVIVAVTFVVGGFMIMAWNVIVVSFRQRVTPDDLLGRVNSAFRLVAWGTLPLGAALGGAIGEWLGVRWVFVLMGLVTLTLFIPNRELTEEALSGASRSG